MERENYQGSHFKKAPLEKESLIALIEILIESIQEFSGWNLL